MDNSSSKKPAIKVGSRVKRRDRSPAERKAERIEVGVVQSISGDRCIVRWPIERDGAKEYTTPLVSSLIEVSD